MNNATTAKEVNVLLDDVNRAEEDLEDELDDYDIPADIRDRRMQQFQKEVQELASLRTQGNHGTYEEVIETKAFLDITTKTNWVVCHFFHPAMQRCKIVDRHMEILSKKHYRTRFIKVNVLLSPFLVEKLVLRILPTIVCFSESVSVARIVGFEDFGNKDTFTTAVFENRLGKSGVLGEEFLPAGSKGMQTNAVRQGRIAQDSDEDFD